MKSYVATLPDGREFFFDANEFQNHGHAADFAVREAGLTRKRGWDGGETIDVRVCFLSLSKGEVTRGPARVVPTSLPLAEMTEAEFNGEMHTIRSTLPDEFGDLVGTRAWEEGHSAGYEEVVNIARDLAGSLAEAVRLYEARKARER